MGATDGTTGYEIFHTIEHSVEAQFQHLLGDATTNQLPIGVVIYDYRLKYVHRGTAPRVEWLGIQENPEHVGWASNLGYGLKVLNVLAAILKMPNIAIVEPQQAPVEPPKPVEQMVQEPEPTLVVEEQPPLIEQSVIEPPSIKETVSVYGASIHSKLFKEIIRGGRK